MGQVLRWGAWEATTRWCSAPSLSPSLPLSLKINKILKKEALVRSGTVSFDQL